MNRNVERALAESRAEVEDYSRRAVHEVEVDYVDIANRLQAKLGVGVYPSTIKEVLAAAAKGVGRE